MHQAVTENGSFDGLRRAHVNNPAAQVDATLDLDISLVQGELDETEAYGVCLVFLHHLVVAVNLTQPGGIQILNARFEGDHGYRYEPPAVDSRIHYGALRVMLDNNQMSKQSPDLETVWRWLEASEASREHTAVKDINKVLLTMLKVAEARNEYSARTVLLVLYQLELLLGCHNALNPKLLRNRPRMVLGGLPEPMDSISELYEIRHGLLAGNQPVRSPPPDSTYTLS